MALARWARVARRKRAPAAVTALTPRRPAVWGALRDDWLRTRLDGRPSGVNLTAVTDCCHSGGDYNGARRLIRLLQLGQPAEHPH